MTENEPETTIRAELPADESAVRALNEAAFESAAEAQLVDILRTAIVQPEVQVAQVALRAGVVVGHALWTPVRVGDGGDELFMALGPMAVLPGHQRSGVGAALIAAGVEGCRELGARALFVLGHSDYYPRFGFEPAAPHGCYFQSERFAAHFFVRLLAPDGLSASSEVHYHPAFDGV